MDIEFHYYITFILARKAGFNANQSYKIAYSSQYTDNNNFRYFINFDDGSHYLNEISQTLDITKPSQKRQKIYPLFHFIPGGVESSNKNQFKGKSYHDFTTIPDSPNAQKLFDAALKSKNLYQTGIAAHAYADTWAHQNFLGYKHKFNGKKGFEKIIPNIGHADFMHEPDKVHNKWKDERLKKRYNEIDNDQRFLEAAKAIYIRFWKHNHAKADDKKAEDKYNRIGLENDLRKAMDETYFWGSDDKARIKAYKEICEELDQNNYKYDPKAWRYKAVEKKDFETDLFDRYWAKTNFKRSYWYKFQEAVKWYRGEAIKVLKPLYKKVGLPI
ncbi:MAG: hypothetical protein JRJ65_04715 [Deltaproteobacteria bacterium]|nr:hypothetical protein [Deltaproteobacteria bacterium]